MGFMSTVGLALLVATSGPPLHADCCALPISRVALMTEEDWSDYSDRVFDAMQDPILTDAALRAVIQYGEYVRAGRKDVISIARIYRDGDIPAMRRMAIVAINQLDDDWGIDYLARSYRFEKDPVLKYTIAAVLVDHAERHREGEVLIGEPQIVWPVSAIEMDRLQQYREGEVVVGEPKIVSAETPIKHDF